MIFKAKITKNDTYLLKLIVTAWHPERFKDRNNGIVWDLQTTTALEILSSVIITPWLALQSALDLLSSATVPLRRT